MREVVEYVEARDALPLEQVDGVRVGRLEERGEDVAAVHLTLARPLGLHERVLDDALEGGGVFRQRLARRGHALQLLAQEALKLFNQRLDVAAALAHDLAGRALVQQRVEQVFERHVLVPPLDRLHRGEVQGLL